MVKTKVPGNNNRRSYDFAHHQCKKTHAVLSSMEYYHGTHIPDDPEYRFVNRPPKLIFPEPRLMAARDRRAAIGLSEPNEIDVAGGHVRQASVDSSCS